MNNHNHKQAFTIIEVVLVLAIAGLIFLMVFIALPALQRNQRDTQRRSDLARMQAALQSYRTNNRGSVALTGDQLRNEFRDNYLEGDEFRDPDGSLYHIVNHTSSYTNRDFDTYDMKLESGGTMIVFARSAKCGENSTESASGNQNFAIFMKLEGGGTYCLDG